MKTYVNLLSDDARSRSAAAVSARWWALALAVLAIVLIPMTVQRWQETRDIRRNHEALEARYAPVRQLSDEIRKYRREAATLVTVDRIPLELAQERPLATLLGLASQAAANSGGELFVEQLTVTQPGVDDGGDGAATDRRLVIRASGTLAYDVAQVVKSLEQAPIKSVKVLGTETVSEQGVDRKNYTIECLF